MVRQRIQGVEDTLRAAQGVLQQKGVEEIADRHGRQLYDDTDIARGLEFQDAMKDRFRRDLAVLAGPEPI